MPEKQIKELALFTEDILRKIQVPLEDFLNNYAVPKLTELNNEESYKLNIKYMLSDLRQLLVACENVINKLGIVRRSQHFNKDYTEHILYETVHHCINKFYFPAHELYEEDGRNSYTGKDAIKFSFETHTSIKELILSLSKNFEILREELNYYETDYVTKKRLEGKFL